MTNLAVAVSFGVLLTILTKLDNLHALPENSTSDVIKNQTTDSIKPLGQQPIIVTNLLGKSNQNGFDFLDNREELDLQEYIEKLNIKYKNFSDADSIIEQRKQTNLQETTIEIVKQLIASSSSTTTTTTPTTTSTTTTTTTTTTTSTTSSPTTGKQVSNLASSVQANNKTGQDIAAASDNDAVESSWQYGIFDRFTRARSTTAAPTPEPTIASIDVRSFNSDECGLKFYEGDYNTGKVGDYNVAAAPGSPFVDDPSQSAGDKPINAREKYTTDKQHKLQESYLQPAQNYDDDNSYAYPHSHQGPNSDTSNLGLKHDWNKELFGHEDANNQRSTNAESSSPVSHSDSDFNLSSRRNWRQQQIGQTLQHLGFNVSEIISMRSNSQQYPRENLMKMSSSKNQKSADLPQINQNAREQTENLRLEPRVIGGTDARLGDSPWAVSLQALVSRPGTGAVEYRHYCGGTLISERYVLTAAHCLDFMVGRESRLFVVVGDLQWRMTPSSTYGRRIPIEKLTIHAGYKSTAFGHDIGLIRLKDPVHPLKVNGRYIINSVCLPEKNVEHTGDAELVGWGLFSNRNEMADTLQIATVPILPRPLCIDLYRRRTGLIQWIIGIDLITDKQVCASTFGRGICQGDSGSPLVFNEKLKRFMAENNNGNNETPQHTFNEQTRSTIIGIVAFGGIRRCSYQSLPGVYMQTSKYMDWIMPKIK